jgi:hypothetical protein
MTPKFKVGDSVFYNQTFPETVRIIRITESYYEILLPDKEIKLVGEWCLCYTESITTGFLSSVAMNQHYKIKSLEYEISRIKKRKKFLGIF